CAPVFASKHWNSPAASAKIRLSTTMGAPFTAPYALMTWAAFSCDAFSRESVRSLTLWYVEPWSPPSQFQVEGGGGGPLSTTGAAASTSPPTSASLGVVASVLRQPARKTKPRRQCRKLVPGKR